MVPRRSNEIGEGPFLENLIDGGPMPLLWLLSRLFSKVKFQKLGIYMLPTHFVYHASWCYKLGLVCCAGNTVIEIVFKSFKLLIPMDIRIWLETFHLGFHSFLESIVFCRCLSNLQTRCVQNTVDHNNKINVMCITQSIRTQKINALCRQGPECSFTSKQRRKTENQMN